MRKIGPNDTVGYGIVGCGVIAPWHAGSLKERVQGAKLLACCDEVPERAQAFAERFELPRYYTRYEELLADPEIDCVSVCTPSGLHSDMVIAASNAGKHAMTEK